MAYFDFLNIILSPLLKLPVLFAVVLMSFIISVIIIVITKYTTNQALMKQLKDEIKEYQKQIKDSRDSPSKAMEIQKKAMESNMKYMTHSLKPTLITFIPIILIFSWMSSTFAYESIKPQQEFTLSAFFLKGTHGEVNLTSAEGLTILDKNIKKIENDKATWTLKGTEGEHIVELNFEGEKQEKNVLITSSDKYAESTKKTNGNIRIVQIDYNPKKILNLFGWKLGWLGTYIIFSIIFTMSLRKIFKVY